jgi:hypothetical protein
LAIESAGNDVIRAGLCEHSYCVDDLWRCLTAVLTPTAPRQAQLSMYAFLPVDDEYHFTGGAIHIDDYLANQRANDALPQAHIGVGIIPHGPQLGGQRLQLLTRRSCHPALLLHMLLDLAFRAPASRA